MRPLRLSVKDFGSFGELDLDFEGMSLAAIVGENGAGKSTLLTAVLVALYGTAVGPLDGFIRQGAQGFKLTLDFTTGGQTYRVTREHGKAQKVSLSKDGVPLAIDKVREVDAAIVDAIGYDYASFTVAHWLRQGDLGRFAGLDPAARKDWLISVLGLDVWPQMEAVAKKRLADERTARTAAEATLGALEEGDQVAVMKEKAQVDADLAVARQALKNLDADSKAIAAELSTAGTKVAAVTRCQGNVNDAERKVQDAQAESDRLDAEVVKLEGAARENLPDLPDTTALEAERQELTEKMKQYDMAVLRKEQAAENLGRAEQAANRADAAITAFDDAIAARPADVCAKCGQPLNFTALEKSQEDDAYQRAALTVAAEDASFAIGEASEVLKAAIAAVPAIDRQAITAHIDAIDKERQNAQTLAARHKERDAAQARLSGVMQAVAASSRTLADRRLELDGAKDALLRAEQDASGIDIQALKERETAAARALTEATMRVSTLEREQATLTEKLRRLDEVAEKRAKAQATLDESGRRASDLELLVKAYSKSGIPARILDIAVGAIETEANEYLSRFASGMTLTITTQRENKTGGIKETLDILVTDGMGTRSLDRMSGGETTRANFALAVGLSRFLARQNGRVESFVVDEPEYLDSRGLAELVSCLHALADDVPLVLVVSHVESITDSLPQRITVKRGSGGSVVSL